MSTRECGIGQSAENDDGTEKQSRCGDVRDVIPDVLSKVATRRASDGRASAGDCVICAQCQTSVFRLRKTGREGDAA